MRIRIFIISGIILAGLLCWHLTLLPLYRYLSINKPVEKPELLIVEGWLDDQQLLEAARIFQKDNYKYLITTGVATPPYYKMWMNGKLIIHIKQYNLEPGPHSLAIEAYSTMAKNKNAEFEVWANDQKIGHTATVLDPVIYKFDFIADANIDTLSISFINDDYYLDDDINLYVSSIAIDSMPVDFIDTINYFRDHANPGFKHVLSKSNALRIKHILSQYNIPEEKIIPVKTMSYGNSRTAETAKITMEFLDSLFSDVPVRANLFSINPHTRRTYLAFKKYKTKNQEIGMLSPSVDYSNYKITRYKNLKELTGILYLKLSPR